MKEKGNLRCAPNELYLSAALALYEDLYQEWESTGTLDEACITDDAQEVTAEELSGSSQC